MDLSRRAGSGRKTGDIPRSRPLGADPSDPNPEIDLVRPSSPNDREILEPDENPRRHTVRLVSPGDRRKTRPASGRGRTHEPFDQSEPDPGRLRSRSPVLTSCEPPICVPTCVPTGVTRTSCSFSLFGDDSRTNRPQLRGNVGALNSDTSSTYFPSRSHQLTKSKP